MGAFGMNLHDLVRGAIPPLHPDESVLLVQSTGSLNVRGVVTPQYADAVQVRAQVQSMGNDDLKAMNDTARTEVQRRAYLYSATPAGLVPQGIVRPLARGGDLLRRADGTWWLVAAMMEDFSASGWVCVRIVQQIVAPQAAQDKAQTWDDAQGATDADSGDTGGGQ